MAFENSLITVDQFLYYNDELRVRELLSDDENGEPIAANQLDSNTYLEEICFAASQEVASAAQVGNSYTWNELFCLANDNVGGTVTLTAGNYALTANTGTTINGAGSKLRTLVANVGWGLLVGRRRFTTKKFTEMAPSYAEAMKQLEMLQLGMRIFPQVSGAPEAGLPGVEVLGVDALGTISKNVGLFGTIALPGRGYVGGDYGGWRHW